MSYKFLRDYDPTDNPSQRWLFTTELDWNTARDEADSDYPQDPREGEDNDSQV